ncbi:hypothetical protein ACGF1Z_22625 [Streptomyces sp. NPDC048018]|uniref:hypothetical protein n=1 Tax=Streptomyces sp. NPDC048018 TaxID=3365499 RepID=UPI003717B456
MLVVAGVKTAPHRYDTDAGDTVCSVFFGLSTLFPLGMTVRFLYRLVTTRGRAAEPPVAASDHEETAAASS